MRKSKDDKRLTPEELSFFCGQVALMLESGVPLYESIDALAENYASTKYSLAFEALSRRVGDGQSFAEAIGECGIFPQYAVKMAGVGESTGRLDSVMRELSAYYEREANLHSAILNAVRYPLALLLIMAAVVVILNARVMPLFQQVYRGLGADVTSTAKLTMNIGSVIGVVVMALVGLILATALACAIWWRSGNRRGLKRIIGKIAPAMGKIDRAITAGRFCSVLSIALSAGYPTVEALRLCADMVSDESDSARINGIMESTERDGRISSAITESGILDALKARMIQVGFATGRADAATKHVAELCERETDERIDRLLSLIEPTLVSVLAVIIGCILLAVMLPLAGVMSSLL